MFPEDEKTIRNRIERLIPNKLDRFSKLRPNHEPYLFDSWSYDKGGRLCLYYIVTGGKREYKKRVPMQELVKAAIRFREDREFNRLDFSAICPIAHGNGSCGYAVIVRILESLYSRSITS